MQSIEKVSARQALQLINASVAEAEKIDQPIAISVCGPEGELVSFLRMDKASPAAATIAQNKAYTAARDRKSTKAMGLFMHDAHRPPAFWGDSGITGFGGGIPLLHQGIVIGGIGISGLSEEEDERIAMAAATAVLGT
jgi:glc operon protein GlcG